VVTPKAEEILGVPPPVFVRKLVRASHWGGPEDQLQQRVSIAVGEVFRSDGSGTFSVYLVERDVDLHRVAIGMNGNRDSLMERLDLVAFSRQEMDSCRIIATQSPGKTTCLHANRHHFDLTATESQLAELCRTAMESGRPVGRLKKRHLRAIVEQAEKEGCRAAVTDSEHCACDDE
jgi:hypothetical protein